MSSEATRSKGSSTIGAARFVLFVREPECSRFTAPSDPRFTTTTIDSLPRKKDPPPELSFGTIAINVQNCNYLMEIEFLVKRQKKESGNDASQDLNYLAIFSLLFIFFLSRSRVDGT